MTVSRIDGYYLYETGGTIHPLEAMQSGDAFDKWWILLYVAQSRVETLLTQSVFRLKMSQAAGRKFVDVLRPLAANAMREEPITGMEAWSVENALREFESVLHAELAMMDIYLVLKKRGYDTTDLILNGSVLFPDDLGPKVPDAIADVVQGCRCIAFELPTAAAFHLHRANESVLHRYYDAVMGGDPRPSGRNIGDYLEAMRKKGAGDPAIRSALKDLKDLHRNPLIHPEHSLDSVDEAIALLGGIQQVVVGMLKVLPIVQPTVGAPPTA